MSKDFINIKNRKTSHEYEFIDKYVAGIYLKGTEIKSIRNSQVNMSDSYCVFIVEELWIRNLHISEYINGGYINHEPKRERAITQKNRTRKDSWKSKNKRGYDNTFEIICK